MKKIYFAAKWNKKDITKTWSGTSYALYLELSKLYDVERINIPNDRIVSFFKILTRKTQLYFWTWLSDLYTHFVVYSQIKDKSIPVFSVGAFFYDNPCYVYVDDIMATYMKVEDDVKKGWGYNPKGYISKKLLDMRLERDYKIYKRANKVFCMGEWLAKYAKSYYKETIGDRFVHVGGGANSIVAQDTYKCAKDGNNILFVGRNYIRKDLPLVIEAFKILQRRRPFVKLYIAGPSSNPLTERVEGISFLGDISCEEVATYMAEADVFCMPSRFEAYGLVFVEALAAGVPCVARDAYEMKHFIEDGRTGRLLKQEDAEELAELIEEILDNKEYTTNIQSAIQSIKEKYSWKNVCQAIASYIEI